MGKNRVCMRDANITTTFCSQEAGMVLGQLDDIKSVNRQQRTKLGSDMLLPALEATRVLPLAIANSVFGRGGVKKKKLAA